MVKILDDALLKASAFSSCSCLEAAALQEFHKELYANILYQSAHEMVYSWKNLYRRI